MLIKRPDDIKPSEITAKKDFLNRRRFMRESAAGVIAVSTPLLLPGSAQAGNKLNDVVKSAYQLDDELTPYDDITSYNNFYEFGTGKSDPVENSQDFKTKPWGLEVWGECENPGNFNLEDFINPHTLEERVYRLRCVEAWSMVIPWVGIPLAPVLKRFKPTSKAKYVAFKTLLDPEQMPGQRRGFLDWPYVEGLRIDEAMNELSLLSVGLYGEELPNQNGAPIRLVVPWKYGFKSIKSIVSIVFTEHEPPTTWNISAPREYGFYSNVNPTVKPSPLEPEERTAYRRLVQEGNPHVQRLRGAGSQPVHRHGLGEVLLIAVVNQNNVTSWVIKPVLFAAALIPLALLIWGGFTGGLGANPVETITFQTGEWALRFLLITLAITPLRRISGWQAAIRLRRMLGLFSFFYVCLHFTTYLWLDQYFSVADILDDIIERPFITVGFTGFILLIPLAVTSTNAMVRRLGGKNWRRLHRLAYVAAGAGTVHFLWLVKADLREPLIYLGVFVGLMALRLPRVAKLISINSREKRTASPTTEPA